MQILYAVCPVINMRSALFSGGRIDLCGNIMVQNDQYYFGTFCLCLLQVCTLYSTVSNEAGTMLKYKTRFFLVKLIKNTVSF